MTVSQCVTGRDVSTMVVRVNGKEEGDLEELSYTARV
jgi:hypothetical protein